MDQIPCPDGYLLDAKSPLAQGHHTLNQYLVRVEEAGWQIALKEINAIRDKARKLLIWEALIERLLWLRQNYPDSACLSPLRGLAERIEKWTLSPTQADLIGILDRTGEAAAFVAPYTPVPHLMAYVEEKGLTPELAAAIRNFRARVWDQSYSVNQVSLQLFRSRLDMLTWRDEWNEVDLKRCWSEAIRADFRRMQGAERENWRRLLHSINGDETTRPAPRWLSKAQTHIQAIGPDAFCAAMMKWCKPLQPGHSQPLSREGSFLLRSFIWLAESLSNPELLARVGDISQVEFKPKSNGQKVIRAAAEAIGKPEPIFKPRSVPASFDSLIARALNAVLSPKNPRIPAELSSRIHVRDQIIHVRGDLDEYQVHISTGTIFRSSDGKRVIISMPASQSDRFVLPDFGGITELLRHVLILAEDARHADALTARSE